MDISSLPYFTPLAKDYFARFDNSAIRKYFSLSPNANSDLTGLFASRSALESSRPSEHRLAVVDSIRELHSSLGIPSEAVETNLMRLAEPNCFAVVTGQQVGIFGGPLYTFYKTYTAILKARQLSTKYPDLAFVPVFWLETEDHDLEEARSIHVLDKDSELRTIRYTPEAAAASTDDKVWRKQVGPLPLEMEALALARQALADGLAPTEFTSDTLAVIDRCYVNGRSFADAFAALLLEYFGNDGLLILNANSTPLKRLARDLFWKEIESSPQLSERIVLQSVKLEEDYHAQVKPKALNLFYVDQGERMPIVERERSNSQNERSFFLKGTRKSFTLTELKALVEDHPERFSPNVVFRPLYQDLLLPTVVYSAGPGEIAYFAQFKPSYEWAGIPMPVILPRISATLVEERFERVLRKYYLNVEGILSSGRGDSNTLLKTAIDSGLSLTFDDTIAKIEAELESLRSAVKQADGSLDGALTSVKGKVITTVRDFQHKTLAAERKRHATTKAQIDKLLASLLPSDELQEREISMIYFLNKYGIYFLSRLKALIEPMLGDFADHHIIHLLTADSQTSLDSDDNKIDENLQEKRTSDASERLVAVPDEQSAHTA